MARLRLLTLLTVVLLAIPAWALAGGWAMTSFDELPTEFVVGESYDLTYTILQHGETPVDVGPSSVQVTDASGNVTTFNATRLPERGRYQVTLTFPESGMWTWEVSQGGFGAHPMGAISVGAGTVVPSPSPLAWLLPLALAITIGLIAVQVAGLAKQRRPARISAE